MHNSLAVVDFIMWSWLLFWNIAFLFDSVFVLWMIGIGLQCRCIDVWERFQKSWEISMSVCGCWGQTSVSSRILPSNYYLSVAPSYFSAKHFDNYQLLPNCLIIIIHEAIKFNQWLTWVVTDRVALYMYRGRGPCRPIHSYRSTSLHVTSFRHRESNDEQRLNYISPRLKFHRNCRLI